MVFAKWATTLTEPYAEIEMPPESEMVDWEAELALVVGKRCRRVRAADAGSVVLGFSIANDVSMRDWQRHSSVQMEPGKAWDLTTPLGPAIVPTSSLGGAEPDLPIEGRLNGEVMQSARTSELVHGIPALVEYISTWTTLEPGDLILTGTGSGVGAQMSPPRFLGDGDVYEVSVGGIGSLSNTFRRSEGVPSR